MVRTSFCYFVWSVGLFCLLSLSAALYWSEQSAKFNHFVSEKTSISSESDKVFVSNVLDIAVRPWPNDPECENFTIEFYRNGARPPMALVSYPGSGNTWIRGIIERLSGYFTGSVYTAKNLFKTGFYGEAMPFECGCTVVQKTHDFAKDNSDIFNHSAILIIRNPFRALVSYRNFLMTGENQTATATPDHFRGLGWMQFVFKETKNWKNLALRWIPRIHEGGILYYEDLLQDKRKHFRVLMQYLGFEVDERRLECVLKHDFVEFKRKSDRPTGNNNTTSRKPFNAYLRGIVNEAIDEIQFLLYENGYGFEITKE